MPLQELALTPEVDEICTDVIRSDRKLFKKIDSIFKKYDPEDVKQGTPPLGEIIAQLVDMGYTPKQSDVDHIDAIATYMSLRAYLQVENMIH